MTSCKVFFAVRPLIFEPQEHKLFAPKIILKSGILNLPPHILVYFFKNIISEKMNIVSRNEESNIYFRIVFRENHQFFSV